VCESYTTKEELAEPGGSEHGERCFIVVFVDFELRCVHIRGCVRGRKKNQK